MVDAANASIFGLSRVRLCSDAVHGLQRNPTCALDSVAAYATVDVSNPAALSRELPEPFVRDTDIDRRAMIRMASTQLISPLERHKRLPTVLHCCRGTGVASNSKTELLLLVGLSSSGMAVEVTLPIDKRQNPFLCRFSVVLVRSSHLSTTIRCSPPLAIPDGSGHSKGAQRPCLMRNPCLPKAILESTIIFICASRAAYSTLPIGTPFSPRGRYSRSPGST